MLKRLSFLVICLSVILALPSCVAKKKFLELQDQKSAVESSLAQAREQIKVLEGEKTELETTITSERKKYTGEIKELNTQLSSEKKAAQKAMAEAKEAKSDAAAKSQQLSSLRSEVASVFNLASTSGFSISQKEGQLYVLTPEPLLFNSGSAYLTKDAKNAITQIAQRMVANPSLKLVIEGHADKRGLVPGARYADNWELSFARARAVVKELVKQGVDPTNLAGIARGEYDPVTEGSDRDALKQNRRTELMLPTNVGALYEKVKG